MFKIQLKGQSHDATWVVEKNYTIGSGVENNLVLEGIGIDRTHARLITQDHKLFLKDNYSRSGCYLNGQRITHKEVIIGDLIRLGDTEIEVLDPQESAEKKACESAVWKLISDNQWLEDQFYRIPQGTVTVGRSSSCDITIAATQLAREHVEITIENDHLRVRDLGSFSGTFINDKRIDEDIARPGDSLRLDIYSFRVLGPAGPQGRTRRRQDQHFAALEKSKTSNGPKKWKTKPTSPGNRIEPEYPPGTRITKAVSVALLIFMAALATFIFTR